MPRSSTTPLRGARRRHAAQLSRVYATPAAQLPRSLLKSPSFPNPHQQQQHEGEERPGGSGHEGARDCDAGVEELKGGKERKGEERRTSRSRSDAIHKRENTLLKEFEQIAKSSVFHDRCIGEALPKFEKKGYSDGALGVSSR